MKEGAHFDSRLARLADVTPPAPLAAPKRLPATAERRNLAAREALNSRVRQEFIEMPGTCLTLAQASRLFGIPHEACGRILTELVAGGRLRLVADRRYRLHSAA